MQGIAGEDLGHELDLPSSGRPVPRLRHVIIVARGEQAWVTKSNATAKLLLELDARYFPESASRVGVDGFDEEISDLSRDLYEARQSDLRALAA